MVLSIYFPQDLIQKLSNIFIQDLAPGRGFMITRRGLFEAAVGAVAFESSGALAAPAASTAGQDDALLWLSPLLPAGTRAEAALETIADKKPLIGLTERPPNYEAPLSYLRTPITPNDEFFVRYHLAGIPQVDASTWTLSIGGPPMATSRSALTS
jgi:sulfite dehydrogenase (cytochrome) subunit A